MFKLKEKLIRCKQFLTTWSKEIVGNNREKIEELCSKIATSQGGEIWRIS